MGAGRTSVALLVLVLCAVSDVVRGGGAVTVRRFETEELEVCRTGHNVLESIPSEGDLKLGSYNVAGKLGGSGLNAPQLSELVELVRGVHVITLVEVKSCKIVNALLNAALKHSGPTVTGCSSDCFSAYLSSNDVAIITQVKPAADPKSKYLPRAFRYTTGYLGEALTKMKIQLFEYKTMKPSTLSKYKTEPVVTRALGKKMVGAFFRTEKETLSCEKEFPEVDPHTLPEGTLLERQAVIVIKTEGDGLLAIIGVHLKAGKPTSRRDVCIRSLQALHLSQIIRYIGFPSVVMGDMNDSLKPYGPYPTPRTNSLKILEKGTGSCRFGWAFDRTVQAAEGDEAKELARRKLISWVGSFYGQKGSLIDHMCIWKGLVDVQAPETWIERVQYPFSDHLPIRMNIPNAATALNKCAALHPWTRVDVPTITDFVPNYDDRDDDDVEEDGSIVASSESAYGDSEFDDDEGGESQVGPVMPESEQAGADVEGGGDNAERGASGERGARPSLRINGMSQESFDKLFPPLPLDGN